jgi:hypothetical protein
MRSAILVICLGCGGAGAPAAIPTTAPELPAYASAAPITAPVVFAPGAVSTAAPEFAIAFSPDGATAYFDRASADRSKLVIMASTFANGAWQPAAPLAFSTGGSRPMGRCWCSSPIARWSGRRDLYASRSRDGAWSPARRLGARINSPFADFAPAFSPDGKYLFFTSERPGIAPTPASGRPPGDIYQVDVSALELP